MAIATIPGGTGPPTSTNVPCPTPTTRSPRLSRQPPRCPRPATGRQEGRGCHVPSPCSAWRCGRHLERWRQRLSQGHPEPIRCPCVTCWHCCVLPGLLPGLHPRMGRLSRYLARGEYGQLRDCPLFESDFLQVTRSGEAASQVTVAIAASSPLLPRPDLLLLARPVLPSPPDPEEELQLLGLLPLSLVRLSLRSLQRHQLRVRLVTGRTFYLQLLAPPPRLPRLFSRWLRLLFVLREAGGRLPQDPPRDGAGLGEPEPQ
ncbi:Golgi-associated RAB2 interactor protein 5A-like [Patagioenas fasciata]|uniref:Golgi-associated RAB2 interactor protein 5A-like n=1 Tax=Patagioenas fasciata TaxID=372321 RepID=UPI0032E8B3E0